MIVLVTGTGTEVGKTWVTTRVAALLRAGGVAVAARKPVQSYDSSDASTDADVLAAATGEPATVVCPRHRRYPVAMAPPMAAEVLGRPPFTIAELVTELRPPDDAVVLVEAAGGARSPLASDGDTATLARALSPAVVIVVADAGLGTINLVLLTVAALAGHRVVVFLNRFDHGVELHTRNRDWLTTREGLEVVTDPEALAQLLAGSLTR